jgi:hypothetical protein
MASKKTERKNGTKNVETAKTDGEFTVLAGKIHVDHWNYVNDQAEALGWTLSKFIREGVLQLAEQVDKKAGGAGKRPVAPEPTAGKRSALGALASTVGLSADEYRKWLEAKAVAEATGTKVPDPSKFRKAAAE